MEGYRELYGSGQEVEVKRATHDGWIWTKARVVRDEGGSVRVAFPSPGGQTSVHIDSVRKPGEDKA